MFHRDHPRACGEHLTTVSYWVSVAGSSPRMRGTPCAADGMPLDVGIIPAHAGNTPDQRRTCHVRRDHPRACGEHREHARIIIRRVGSSPRMRGTLDLMRQTRDAIGIIPAHAGNTALQTRRMWCGGDHPRACGEHSVWPSRYLIRVGSSPRMRGTLVRYKRFEHVRGIIPAHAGNTRRRTVLCAA